MMQKPHCFVRIDGLADADSLGAVVGAVVGVRRERLIGLGASGSYHERLTVDLRSGGQRQLMLKHIELDSDFTVYRTGGATSREVALLSEPALDGVWDVFSCPYVAFAQQGEMAGLLKEDVSVYLVPDIDEPIGDHEEARLLSALANLHASYWESDVLTLPWLASPASLFGLLGPHAAAEENQRASPHQLLRLVARGWAAAFARLPKHLVDMLSRPAEALAGVCADLPRTLLHGDTKVANFAFLPDGGVVAFDWALMGFGPSTLDLGWYLAVNSGRLTRPREDVIVRYRSLLESRLGRDLPEGLWAQMVSAGILHGALMSLWEKALSMESGTARAADEWGWWVDQLVRRFPPSPPARSAR